MMFTQRTFDSRLDGGRVAGPYLSNRVQVVAAMLGIFKVIET